MKTIYTALCITLLDQITKYTVTASMDLGETLPLWKGIFHLTYIINPGAAFGILPHQSAFFLAIVAALFLVFIWLRKRIPETPFYFPIAIGLLLGGALGNAIDRVRISGVIDFLDFRIWPIFNVADIAVCVGVALIVLYFWRTDHDGT